MSCKPGVAGIPLDDIDKWTNSLRQLLDSRDGRRHFRNFMRSRHLEGFDTLEFWELCEKFLRSSGHSGHCSRSHDNNIGNTRFMEDAKDLVAFAEDKVNFDLGQLGGLMKAVNSGEEENIKTHISQAMQIAFGLLQHDYEVFRKHLLRQRDLLSSEHR